MLQETFIIDRKSLDATSRPRKRSRQDTKFQQRLHSHCLSEPSHPFHNTVSFRQSSLVQKNRRVVPCFHTRRELHSSTAGSESQSVDQQYVEYKQAINDAPNAHAKLDLVRKSNSAGILCVTKITHPTRKEIRTRPSSSITCFDCSPTGQPPNRTNPSLERTLMKDSLNALKNAHELQAVHCVP